MEQNEDIGVLAITVTGKSDPPEPVDDTLAIDAGATGTKNASKGVLKMILIQMVIL